MIQEEICLYRFNEGSKESDFFSLKLRYDIKQAFINKKEYQESSSDRLLYYWLRDSKGKIVKANDGRSEVGSHCDFKRTITGYLINQGLVKYDW